MTICGRSSRGSVMDWSGRTVGVSEIRNRQQEPGQAPQGRPCFQHGGGPVQPADLTEASWFQACCDSMAGELRIGR